MLRRPDNLDVGFAYAEVAAQLGDYEAAVSALGRMLLFNPNLPRVQLKLGALYFWMGSFDLARAYFDKTAAANLPPAVRQRINDYLAQIERA
jgi:tetratricopeptide (TPR) repeat protein